MNGPDAMNLESMDPAFHRETQHFGWRLPQSEEEVRDAEPSVEAFRGELPDPIRDDANVPAPEEGPARAPGLIERYMRDGGADGPRRGRGREAEAPRRAGPERE